MSESSNKFLDEMAEDFFAECDELLAVIKGNLLKLDMSGEKEKVKKPLLEELLRSCHTLKGLAGMIGAEGLMNLTHAIESYLKSVYQEDLLISSSKLDVLFRSTGFIEKYLESLRSKTTPPGIEGVLREVTLISGREEASTVSEGPAGGSEAREVPFNKEEKNWKFYFEPSKELYDEGININTIRSELTGLGSLINSMPRTGEDGKISFEFTISSSRPETDFNYLKQKGVTFEPAGLPNSSSETEEKSSQGRQTKNIVRVDLEKLESIMRSVGDLVISRSRLDDILKRKLQFLDNGDAGALREINNYMERQIKTLRMGVMDLRLVSIGEAFERLRFAIRDLVTKSNKMLNLRMEGQETHIDKFIMDRMFDPLLHIVRNAISHGIETPSEREAAGKPPEGTLLLKASASGNSVVFEIADDGMGIDRARVKDKAVKAGLISVGSAPDNEMLLSIISTPGFSIKESSDVVSGRGIGMDVVMKAVDELGGSVQLETEKGKGTRFMIQLPLTLSIVDALIVSSGDDIFAVPMPVVNEIIRFNTEELIKYDENEMIPYRDSILPVIRLDEFFGKSRKRSGQADAIVTGIGKTTAGIMVDGIKGQREIVVRSLSDPLVKVDGISGATDLGEGKIVLIIDVPAIIRASLKKSRPSEKSLIV